MDLYDFLPEKKGKALDLGCGNRKIPGSTGIDSDPNSNADIIFDLEKGIPMKDEMMNLVICRHLLEHLHDPVYFFDEIYRVLKKDGGLILVTEKPKAKKFWDDPTHVRPYNRKSLETLSEKAGFKKYQVYNWGIKGINRLPELISRFLINHFDFGFSLLLKAEK